MKKYYNVVVVNKIYIEGLNFINSDKYNFEGIYFTLKKDNGLFFKYPIICEKVGDTFIDIITKRTYKIACEKNGCFSEDNFYNHNMYMSAVKEIKQCKVNMYLKLLNKNIIKQYVKNMYILESRCRDMNYINEDARRIPNVNVSKDFKTVAEFKYTKDLILKDEEFPTFNKMLRKIKRRIKFED